MYSSVILAAVLLAQASGGGMQGQMGQSPPANGMHSMMQAPCSTNGPAISSARLQGVSHEGALNRYHIAVTVTNGGPSQPGNTLQSVQIYQNGDKNDQKGVPPLKTGQSYTFVHDFLRSSDANERTTNFRFTLTSATNCAVALVV